MNNKYNDLFNVTINYENIELIKYACTAPLAEIILTKKYYISNIELKNFTSQYLNEEYKDYLFAARPALYARVIKDIFKVEEKDYPKILSKAEAIKRFIDERNENNKYEKKENAKIEKSKNTQKSTLKEWSKLIYPEGHNGN